MHKITSGSKKRVIELIYAKSDRRVAAPRGMTIRRLLRHKRYRSLRDPYLLARIEGNHLVCVENLERLGFDLIG